MAQALSDFPLQIHKNISTRPQHIAETSNLPLKHFRNFLLAVAILTHLDTLLGSLTPTKL